MSSQIFTEVSAEAGIRHRHFKPVLDHQLDNIMSWVCSVGAAAAAGDYNNDGWIDLYVTNSRKGKPNYLYRNNGDGTFTDIAGPAGVADLNGDSGVSMDCVWADYDNDGWIDLYVVRWGRDVLFRNNGDGTFSDVTERCFRQPDGSPGTPWANGNAVVFFDYNLDGRLDLYVGNYFRDVDLWHLKSTRIMHDDFEKSRNGGTNFLYRQDADGRFSEVASSMGVEDPGWTLAVGSADINNDGWPDLYCADDFGPDQLFLNRSGMAGFANVSQSAIGPDSKKGMNVDFGDFDNDGWLDIYVSNITTAEYLQEGNMLWHNNGLDSEGTLTFTDVSLETGTYDGGWGWGAKFFDYDNDGDLDLVAANGFISGADGDYWYDLASWTVLDTDPADARNWPTIGDRSFSGYESLRLFRNEGMYFFTERARELGLQSLRDGRGVVCFDYDNDGDVDVFVANQDQQPHLYANKAVPENHWLLVALQADASTGVNRDGIGTRVTVVTSGGTQIRERDGGNGYGGQSDPRLHFGLGSDDSVALLEVRWPDGGLQYLENIAANQILQIRQQPERYASQLDILIREPSPWPAKPKSATAKAPSIDPAKVDQLLSELEDQLRNRPQGYALESLYRARCATYGRHDRAIRFFTRLLEQIPGDVKARIQLACAYVDKIPTCGGLATIVCKGSLSRKSLDQLDAVIARQPDSWAAHYCRGMNHLHWPRALRHSDDSVSDFERCIELQALAGAVQPSPHYVRAYIGLGDACTKAQRYDQARSAWHTGLALFPHSLALENRLAIADDGALLKFVEDQRSLQRPIDADLSFLDRKP
ncbi:MAG: VCBS repeat-containing protein [Planctomycetes bacterium]|nr:VCBS repeat-containing protein [Planctomycetota bacterium]